MTNNAVIPEVTESQEQQVADFVQSGTSHGIELWDPPTNIASWSWGKDATYIYQICISTLPIWLADMFAVFVTVGLSVLVFQVFGGVPASLNWAHVTAWCFSLSIACLISGLYPSIGLSRVDELRGLMRAISAIVAICSVYDVIHGGDNKYLMLWPIDGVLMCALVPVFRVLARRLICRREWWGLKTILVGGGDRGLQIFAQMKRSPTLGFKPIAIVDSYRSEWIFDDRRIPKSGINPMEETPSLSAQHRAYCGIFIGSEFPIPDRMTMIDRLTSVFPQLYVTADSADAGRQWSGNLLIGSTRLLQVTENLLMPGARWIKRAIDIAATLIVSPLVLPLVFCLALVVKLTSPGPAFFCHKRIGRNGRQIRVWKLRSMVSNADMLLKHYLAENPHLRDDWERLHKLPNDPRVTTIGKILRQTSLDEIPQLWNVFRGDMSLVGPRPIVQAEIEKYQAVYPLYLRVTPGITGLWQINGRNSTTYEQRIAYDAEYIRNWSVFLDLYILARTVQTVVTCDGAC